MLASVGTRGSGAGGGRMTRRFLPLDGVRVIDLTTSYAGPIASMHLGDLGADVIKIERPGGGDDCRTWGPPFVDGVSAWFASANRNKRSLTLDVRADAGRAALDRLLATAQAMLVNVSPPKLARLRLTPDEVLAAHPRLVYCSLTGFGVDGPDSGLLGYDLIAQARSGLMSVTGELGGAPQRPSTALTDIVAAYVCALSIVAALRDVERTGRGVALDVSLLDVALNLMAPRIASYLAGEPEPRPSGATDSVLSIYRPFRAADRTIVIAIGNDAIWRRFCAAIERPDLGQDPRFGTNELRRNARSELTAVIEAVIAQRVAAEWLERFEGADVPSAAVQFLSEVVADPQVKARRSILVGDGGEQRLASIETPWRVIGGHRRADGPVPEAGQHGEQILREVGLSDDDLAALRACGAFADGRPPR
ncbi:CoA transferase [Jatrophihabitans cynanchi]|uniref:CoA transferase n=1 Tax=Jatrophihabitans cynanchi TaxID=2944128 RepID=A0ABY7K5K0_9ACTN|nr:CoA transferase [Jatrophihabitans sp. SB3-54]WAX58386.1 CoA transferase [Jatrophihabitans sp. SB3-54]